MRVLAEGVASSDSAGTLVAVIIAGLAGLGTALGSVITAVRRVGSENAGELRARAEKAEVDRDDYRGRYEAEVEVSSQLRVLALRHGLQVPTELRVP